MPIFFKGIKIGFPPKIKIFIKPKWEKFIIQMNAPHIVGDDEEQKDWLKITGLSFGLIARNESTMIGGRWNVETMKWEFNVYSHLKGEEKPIYTGPLFETDLGEEFSVVLGVDRDRKMYHWAFQRNGKNEVVFSQPYKKGSKWIARMVSPWAGGTLPGTTTHIFTVRNTHL